MLKTLIQYQTLILIKTATLIFENIITEENELDFPVKPLKICKIVQLMPVIYVNDKNQSYFLNLHKFVYLASRRKKRSVQK